MGKMHTIGDVAAESGTCDTPRSMPVEDLPDDIRRIKSKCRINRC